MLSRLDDARVFLSSDDVVLGSSAARQPFRHSARAWSSENESENESEDESEEESELRAALGRLHPQHPYNMRRSVLSTSEVSLPTDALALPPRRKQSRRALTESNASQPMEFVILPSGDIRPRDECPPGLALPPSTATKAKGAPLEIGEISDGSRLGRRNEELQRQERDGERSEEKTAISRDDIKVERANKYEQKVKRKAAEKAREAPTKGRTRGAREAMKRVDWISEDEEVNGGGDSGFASASSTAPAGNKAQERQYRRRKLSVEGHKHQTKHRGGELQVSSDEGDELEVRLRRRSGSGARRERARQVLSASIKQSEENWPKAPRATSRRRDERSKTPSIPSRMNVPPPRHIAELSADDDDDENANEDVGGTRPIPVERAASERLRRTPTTARKLDVAQLASKTEPLLKVVSKEEVAVNASGSQSELVKQLEEELQREKKRVLEKMTLLLEEQGKNQQLHRQVETLESQLVSANTNATSNATKASQDWETRAQALEQQHSDAVKSMELQLQQKDSAILQLEQDKDRLREAVAKLRDRAAREKTSTEESKEIEVDLKAQLEQLIASIRKFLKRVDRWKANSKDAMDCCDRSTDLAALMENMWLDFPRFPNWKESARSDNNADEADSQSVNIVRFLKKRVRSREEEFQQLQAKYVELKELCARQCVREADLQNFINEHRLRGNLIIRKDGSNGDEEVGSKKGASRQQRAAKAVPSSARGDKPESYYEEEEEEEEEEDEDSVKNYRRGNNNDSESSDEAEEDEVDYPMQEPKIFVQIGREGVYEHTPGGASAVREKIADQQRRQGRKKAAPVEVERIRLVPSPSLSQRYERVATPTSVAASRKKPSGRASAMNSRSIPGTRQPTTSTSSSRRQASGALRSKPAITSSARSASVTASSRTNGLLRPWV